MKCIINGSIPRAMERETLGYIPTARDFAEVHKLRMWELSVASRGVGVLIALVQPRIVITAEAIRKDRTGFHAVLETFEFAKQLSSTRNMESFCDAQYFHL